MQTNKITIALKNVCYDILIGENLENALLAFLEKNYPKAKLAILTDQNVEKFYLEKFKKILEKSQRDFLIITLPAGEQTKSFASLEQVLDKILAHKLERNDILIALGGGVIGDLTGFAAAIARRSMPFIQIPTTLLAQIDSSIGGKTGINSQYGKNLIGSFYQPAFVLCDLSFLKTLPQREFLAGYAEMVKYGLINNKEFFAFLEKNFCTLRTDKILLQQAIHIACQAKADIVARDEKEQGERALLNLGHSFGHAFEAYYHYDNRSIIHGEAVALGMMLAFEFSNKLGYCSKDCVLRLKSHLQKTSLPINITDLPNPVQKAQQIFDLMLQDKKITKGEINLILVKDIGEAFIAKNIKPESLLNFLREKIEK